MEHKKKVKIALIISLVSVFVIAAVLGTFFAIRAINNKKNGNSASNVNSEMSISDRLFEANKAIINKQVSSDFNGTYTFKTVSSIIFNSDLTADQITLICEKQGTSDPNGLQKKLLDAKNEEVAKFKEEIVLKAKSGYGSYTKSYNSTNVVEYGKYYGNNDLSEIRVFDETKNDYISKYDMSLTKIKQGLLNSSTTSDNTNNNLLYIYKDVYNTSGTVVLFTITYVYELMPPLPVIPDSDLDFDI